MKGVTKGDAITELIAKLGIDKKDTYAFGDADNDVEMMQAVGTGIAMGRHSEKVGEVASMVDDTLYNLMEPFEKAHKELMAARTDADCEELFEASRTYSDEAFCMSREGKISEDEEFAYRVQKTYADVGVEVSKEEAKQFEERLQNRSLIIAKKITELEF